MICAATGKLRHVDEAAARAAQGRLDYGDKVQPYPCPECSGWHLGGHHRRHRGDVYAQAGLDEAWGGIYPSVIGGTTIRERVGSKVATCERISVPIWVGDDTIGHLVITRRPPHRNNPNPEPWRRSIYRYEARQYEPAERVYSGEVEHAPKDGLWVLIAKITANIPRWATPEGTIGP